MLNSITARNDKGCYRYFKGVRLFMDYVNLRVKILEYEEISEDILKDIIEMARGESLGKIISNVNIKAMKTFISSGFQIEGMIYGFFKGEDALCVSYFLDSKRAASAEKDKEDAIIQRCMESKSSFKLKDMEDITMRDALRGDIFHMTELFKAVFETYPSPVFDEEYIKSNLNKTALYKVACIDGRVVAAASADMDKDNLNAEITDCATYPQYRGRGILSNLIYYLEQDLKERNFYCAYSLSRAINPGINMALCKHGYKYTGRMLNNCDICGSFEDMNIWSKTL
ncbi:beta-lysine acetyltransferase [Anaerobacterium chartisolvens]|uniref:Beta-lysine acetyltransferase n=1 Tax=Anaerobacterium chartisolvens TaxID=1297424 RepID=A0A369B8K5_9FIRM|nr:putative beta-lysine N-acetyltransferase [Anaerobacterium chartisolvens]RCX17862.1 beta-lysine acetyltransferase [Anaerobacterium chartisolvens]